MKNFDFGKFTTKQVFFPSKDGTKVPMFIVHRKVSLLTIFLIIPRRSQRDIVLASSVRPSIYSVRPHFLSFTEPYLSTYWSDLIHSWYK